MNFFRPKGEVMPKDQDQNQSHEKGQAPSVVVPITGKSRHRSPKNNRGVTGKQQAFIEAIIEGNNISDAYRLAYDASNMSNASIHVEACRLAKNPNVSLMLDRYYSDMEANNRLMTLTRRDRVISKLEQVALRDGEADGTQVRALELLGKSMGLWIDKVETEDKTERTEQQLEKDIEQKLIALGIK